MDTPKKIVTLVVASLGALVIAAIVLIVALGIDRPVVENRDEEMAWAYETCRYGASMFYIGRGYDADEANTLAHRDCDKAREDMGDTEFVWFYSPEAAPS